MFRATAAADHVQLDLARQLTVGRVWLDGKAVPFQHPGKNLLVEAPVAADSRHVVELTYAGTPEPVVAPTDRGDFSTTGWTIASDGTVVDDAGAVRRLQLVRRQRPPVRQGVLRRHHPRAEGRGRGLQRRR